MDCAAVSRLGTNAPVSTRRYSRIAILFSAQPTMQRSCERGGSLAQELEPSLLHEAGASLHRKPTKVTWTAGMGGEKLAAQFASQQTCPVGHFVSVPSE